MTKPGQNTKTNLAQSVCPSTYNPRPKQTLSLSLQHTSTTYVPGARKQPMPDLLSLNICFNQTCSSLASKHLCSTRRRLYKRQPLAYNKTPRCISWLKRLGSTAQNLLLQLDKGKISKFPLFQPFQSWLWPCLRKKVSIRVNFSICRLRPTK